MKEEIINIIKRYSADNDDLDNVWKTCDDLIKLIEGFSFQKKGVIMEKNKVLEKIYNHMKDNYQDAQMGLGERYFEELIMIAFEEGKRCHLSTKSVPKGKEVCKCGHYRRNHYSLKKFGDNNGDCCFSECNCKRFSQDLKEEQK